ncbi:hypothetical protein THAOC_01034 [Thalassiosira oceanica]|uniref:Uncharacterized protein n=1 Tax=Thalassiosira oceanica TaxID=159749 RepID=K0TR44_THAOC|nr:hypothetical protein THAOC_01034 [Thalassiosira oceanica]|eukprot:EJK77152.1 hypothetical protein THAOC_01034 [Thalassiosira oceanica]
MSRLWDYIPGCIKDDREYNNPRGSGLVIVPLSEATAEGRKLFEQREAVGHGVIQEQLLMQALGKLKSALESNDPSVASHLYLVYSTTDEGGIVRDEEQTLIGAFTRARDVLAPTPNGLGTWRDESGENIVPDGLGLEGLVRNGYRNVGEIVPDGVEWTRVMDAYSEARASAGLTYYVKDHEGNLLNGGKPFSSIREFVREVNGESQTGLTKLQEEITRNGLGATRGGKPEWKNPDKTKHGEATWTDVNDIEYTIRSSPFLD